MWEVIETRRIKQLLLILTCNGWPHNADLAELDTVAPGHADLGSRDRALELGVNLNGGISIEQN